MGNGNIRGGLVLMALFITLIFLSHGFGQYTF
jgi:hypothetical protein